MPALAQTEDELTGLDRARQAMQQALEYSANDLVDAPPTIPPGHADGNPGKANPGKANPGKANPGKANPGKANPGKGSTGKGNSGELTGRARAAAAIASAIARGNGNGNGFGRGHALEVIQMLRDGTTPASLESDGNHGAEVSAMVKAYNELKAQARTTG